MKIAISATGASLDADTEPRFGRCSYFIIADPETLEFEAMNNAAAMAAGGAGISAAQAIVDEGVQAVLTGNCGPNAYQVLSAAGIQIMTGVSGKVKDAIEGYRSGKFKSSDQANAPDHFGMRATPAAADGAGMNRGMGMGKGCGRGRGMGRGMGRAMTSPAVPPAQQPGPEPKLEELKDLSKSLEQQLADIQRRIEELEKK
jgi:predicted Fe-Mo cluster-binding NifX family protein